MAVTTIEESGMEFGPFEESHLYKIEHSPLHVSVGEGVKIAEFVFYDNASNSFWIVEAKSSSPKPGNREDFSSYIREIEEKLTNALFLLNSAIFGCHGVTDMPEVFVDQDNFCSRKYKFFLVIKGHDKKWLPPLQDAMKDALRRYLKTWKIPSDSILVINDEIARHRGLIRQR